MCLAGVNKEHPAQVEAGWAIASTTSRFLSRKAGMVVGRNLRERWRWAPRMINMETRD